MDRSPTGIAAPAHAVISPAWALRFLLDRGLLTPAEVLDGTPSVEELSISHRSFLVGLGSRPRWFVKRADPVHTGGRDLGVEARVYRLAVTHPELAGVIPRCRLIGERGGLLVLDALDAQPLTSSGLPDARILRAYGDAVARSHRVRPPPFGQPPWLLVALEPRWGNYAWLPPGCAALLGRFASSATLQAAFQQARRQWRPRCLIHGDIRWANALLDRQSGRAKVWLVDWELACLGDPAWDVGSLLADAAATTALLGCPDPLGEEWLAMCTPILSGYRAAARSTAASSAPFVEQSIRLAGIRLVQTIIEHGHASAEDLEHAEAALLPPTLRFLTQPGAIASALAAAAETAGQ